MKEFTQNENIFHNETDFDSVILRLASPEKILGWSFGEVTRPETINYRTQRSEKGGLFDEKIFGPEKDYECYCGKYKGIRYKGIICEKCNVEITRSVVRRHRMGHIELASPVSHIWFLKSIPSRLGLILNLKMADLEKVIYFAGYIITDVDEAKKKEVLVKIDEEFKKKAEEIESEEGKEKLKEVFSKVKKDVNLIKKGIVIDEIRYSEYAIKYKDVFTAEIGAEAIYNICKKVNLKKLEKEIEKNVPDASSVEKPKMLKRLTLIRSLINSGVKPEHMFMLRVPVTPAALRPMVALGGGRFAASDVNDLYRRVINRNNRLKKLMAISAPEVILRNEKRILQEAVDALIDNSMRATSGAAMSASQRRPLKSLSDNLKGKQGLFRQNLLGKRVDYSGRSVIVIGPHLKMDECGLPKHMALELFRPFVISKLIGREMAHNIKIANKLIDDGVDEVWAILEEVIEGKYVLLNRAPTLHKLGVQAFKPLLIEGKSIQVHPLVCSAFNADFDGDQMAVHVPLSDEAQMEAKEIMAADKNVLKPGSAELITQSTLDIVLGCYWATKSVAGLKGEDKFFSSPNDAINAWDFGLVDFRAKIKVLGTSTPKYKEFENVVFETTVGRLLFNSFLPSDYIFVNDMMDKKAINKLEDDLIAVYGLDGIPKILDNIKEFGFKYATKSGITWSNEDVVVPDGKGKVMKEGEDKVEAIWDQFNEGLLSKDERKRKNVEVWHETKGKIDDLISDAMVENSSVSDMVASGARGKKGNLSTMAGMKGIVQNVVNEAIEFPVKSSAKEGLDPIEYFITTHGSRKGLADTALNTAKSGYITRRLFDVCQDIIIREKDCKSKDFVTVTEDSEIGIVIPISKNIKGRVLANDIQDEKGKVLYKKGHFVTIKDSLDIEAAGIKTVDVFSPVTCRTLDGVCQKCYGMDMGKDVQVDLGETIGTIAAQAIGEPGTQLTMRTFHSGGAATAAGDITMGLPRVEEIFERRKPKVPTVISKTGGEVLKIEQVGQKKIMTILADEGTKKGKEVDYTIPFLRTPIVKEGDIVKKGDFLTDGSANLEEMLKYAGKERTQNYIIAEAIAIYELQGSSVSRKHVEVVIKQMFSRSRITNSGDSKFAQGQVVENSELEAVNIEIKANGGELAEGDLLVLGISEVSLSRKSFLSSASFQHTTRMLIDNSIKGSEDPLRGLKENVIIGRLIPAGSGFEGSEKQKLVQEVIDANQAIMEQRMIEEEEARALQENTED